MVRADPARPTRDAEERLGLSFALGLLAGLPLIAYGVWWLLDNARFTNPPGWGRWLLAILVGHDVVFVPLVTVVALLTARATPTWLRTPVQAVLALSAVVVLTALPVVSGNGRRPSNLSLLPHDYVTNLAIVLAGLWIAAAVWALVRRRRTRDPHGAETRTASGPVSPPRRPTT